MSSSHELNKYHKYRSNIEIRGQPWNELTDEFTREIASTAPHQNLGDKTPRFTEPHGKYLYTRLKAVHKNCTNWENLSTVWLSLRADEKDESGNWVDPLWHDDGFRSDSVRQARSRARDALDIEQWAGIWLMTPRKTGYSHKHYALWLDCLADVWQIQEAFEKVVESHIRAHPTATKDGNPLDKAVKVRKEDDCNKLLPEIGHNIPEIGPDEDIRNLSEEWQAAKMWAAMYWDDDRIRQYELGQYEPIADRAKDENLPQGDEWVFGKGWK